MSLTTDFYKAPNGLTILVITGSWFTGVRSELVECVLDFREVKHPHDGPRAAEALLETLMEYRLLDNVLGITANNAANLDAALDIKIQCLDIIRLRCGSHVLNLVVKAGLEEFADSVKCLRSIAKLCNQSGLAQQEFEKMQRDLGIEPLRIPRDVATR